MSNPCGKMNPLHIGIVGAGGMGRTHARRWRQVPRTVVTAIADPAEEAAKNLAEEAGGAAVFAHIDELLAHAPVDVVSVCTPTGSHADLAVAALSAGKHVFCEKPMALSVADCDRMIAAAQRAGRLLSVGQVVRFFAEYANAKRLVDSGAVGAPAVIRCRRGGGFPRWSPWFADAAQSGGVLFDLGVHEIDWLLWCFGPATRVYARALTDSIDLSDPRDYGLITIRHASGAVSHVEACWADPASGYTAFEIAGDAGLLAHDSRKTATLLRSTAHGKGASAPLAPEDDPYLKEIAAFAAAVRGEQPLAVTAEEGRAAIAAAAAALESARTGRAISL